MEVKLLSFCIFLLVVLLKKVVEEFWWKFWRSGMCD